MCLLAKYKISKEHKISIRSSWNYTLQYSASVWNYMEQSCESVQMRIQNVYAIYIYMSYYFVRDLNLWDAISSKVPLLWKALRIYFSLYFFMWASIFAQRIPAFKTTIIIKNPISPFRISRKKSCLLLILRLVRGLSKTGKVTEETCLMYFKENKKITKRINM